MAHYTIAYACGHNVDKQLYGKDAQRQRYIDWAAKGDCPDCAKQDTAKALEAAEAEHALPALTGSEKQIPWARQIRLQKIGEIVAYLERSRAKAEQVGKVTEYEQVVAMVLQTAYAKDHAAWWIDNRDQVGKRLAEMLAKEARQ